MFIKSYLYDHNDRFNNHRGTYNHRGTFSHGAVSYISSTYHFFLPIYEWLFNYKKQCNLKLWNETGIFTDENTRKETIWTKSFIFLISFVLKCDFLEIRNTKDFFALLLELCFVSSYSKSVIIHSIKSFQISLICFRFRFYFAEGSSIHLHTFLPIALGEWWRKIRMLHCFFDIFF